MELAGLLIVATYFAGLVVLAVFALHRLWLVVRDRTLPAVPASGTAADWTPRVTVQLPLYNERYVVRQLLAAVARLDWPRDRLQVQVLDDSTDETVVEAAAGVARLRALGIDAQHRRRPVREGFKAGALADGLRSATGEFVLVLDADFVPPPNLLRRLLPPLRDRGVGMVQARWGHRNQDANALTQTEAVFLDAHFLLETGVRARAGVFFNFHGTAGVWRRRAIEEAGGWSADTLTEDLDLSYRAQMAGWRFVYLPDVVVPAELPETLAAYKRQQARWTQGAAATAKKLLPALLAGPWPWAVKREALMHLGAHVVYPATLLVSVLAVPAVLLRHGSATAAWLWLDALLAAAIIVPTRVFYAAALRRTGRGRAGVLWTVRLLLTATALATSNARAAWRGWRGGGSDFERTPKARGVVEAPGGYRASAPGRLRWLEGGVALWLAGGLILAAGAGALGALPFFALMAIGFAGTAVRG